MDSPSTFPTDRLIEYFALCGPGEELLPAGEERPGWYRTPSGRVHPTRASFAPRLLDRYPLLDHADTPLPTGVADFCFPLLVKLARKNEPLPSAFTFITTSSKGERLHGYCLTFWEELSAAQAACVDPLLPVAPPATAAAVDEAIMMGPAPALGSPARASLEPPCTPTTAIAGGLEHSVESERCVASGSSSSEGAAVATAAVKATATEASVVGTSSSAAPPQPSASPPPQPPRLFAPKCFCVLSRWCFPAFRTLLSELYRMSLTPQAIPLERTLVSICAEVALPPAGRVEVLYPLGSTTLVFKRPPKNRRVSAMNLPMREVLEALEPAHLVSLVTAVLLERQVLLVSSQLSLLTATADVVCALLYPFRFAHTVIPVCPLGLAEVLGAPTPYILGMHVDAWRASAAEIPPGVIQVDLDRNRMWVTGETPFNSSAGPHGSTRGGAGRRGSVDDVSAGDESRPDSARSVGSLTAGALAAGPTLDEALPRLPDKQRRKLMRALAQHADVFARRPADWIYSRLPTFDSAFSFASRPDELPDDGGGGYGGVVAGGEGASDEGALNDPDTDDDERGPAAHGGRIQHSISTTSSKGRLGGGGGHLGGSSLGKGLQHMDAAATSLLFSPVGGGGGDGGPATASPPSRVNWGATRRAFFRVYVSLLLRYREFLVFPTPENPFPRSRFQKEAFLREAAAPESRAFLSALLETQMFADFIDDRVQPSPTCEVDVTFFDESCDAKLNRSVWTLPKKETPFLSSSEFAISRSVVALAPDVTALPPPRSGGYLYSPWPVPCNARLYCTPREISSFADKLDGRSGRYPFHALRRSGAHFSALQRFAVASMTNSSTGGPAALAATAVGVGLHGPSPSSFRTPHEDAGPPSVAGVASRRYGPRTISGHGAAFAGSHASGGGGGAGSGSRLSPEAHVYHAWFLAFSVSLDVIASDVTRRAGQEFDARELAAAAATQASHFAALRAAAGPPGSPSQLHTLTQSGALQLERGAERGDEGAVPRPAPSSVRSASPLAAPSVSRSSDGGASEPADPEQPPFARPSPSASSRPLGSSVGSGSGAASGPAPRAGSVAAAALGLVAGGAASSVSGVTATKPVRAGSVAAAIMTGASSAGAAPSASSGASPPPPVVTVVAAPPKFALPPELALSPASLTPGAPLASAAAPGASLLAPRAGQAAVPALRLIGSSLAAAGPAPAAAPSGHRRQPTMMRREAALAAAKAAFFSSQVELAFDVYGRMRSEGHSPDEMVFSLLLELCGRSSDYERARWLVRDLVGQGFEHDAGLHRLLFTAFYASNPDAVTASAAHSLPSLSSSLSSPAQAALASPLPHLDSPPTGGAFMAPASSPGLLPSARRNSSTSSYHVEHPASAPAASDRGGGLEAPLHTAASFSLAHGHSISAFADTRRARPSAATPCFTSYVIDGDSPLHASGAGGGWGDDVTAQAATASSGGGSGGSAKAGALGSRAAAASLAGDTRASSPGAAQVPAALGAATGAPGSKPLGLPPLAPASSAAAQRPTQPSAHSSSAAQRPPQPQGVVLEPAAHSSALPPAALAAAAAPAAATSAPTLASTWHRIFGRRGSNASDTRPSPRAGSAAATTLQASSNAGGVGAAPRSRSASGSEGRGGDKTRSRAPSQDSAAVVYTTTAETREALSAAAAAAPPPASPASALSSSAGAQRLAPPPGAAGNPVDSSSNSGSAGAVDPNMRLSQFLRAGQPASAGLRSVGGSADGSRVEHLGVAAAGGVDASSSSSRVSEVAPDAMALVASSSGGSGDSALTCASALRSPALSLLHAASGATGDCAVANMAPALSPGSVTTPTLTPPASVHGSSTVRLHAEHDGASGGSLPAQLGSPPPCTFVGVDEEAESHNTDTGTVDEVVAPQPSAAGGSLGGAPEQQPVPPGPAMDAPHAGPASADAPPHHLAAAAPSSHTHPSPVAPSRVASTVPPPTSAPAAASSSSPLSVRPPASYGLAALTIHSTLVDRAPTEAVRARVSVTQQLGALRLTARFPDLLIDTLRETCPACERPLTDADIRAGWLNDENSYTTTCPRCPPLELVHGVPRRATFVARFAVTSSADSWRGSTGVGAGAPLLCEFLPPAVLIKELQHAVAHGQLGPYMRAKSPTLFWNMLLAIVQLGLPAEFTSFLARDAGEVPRPPGGGAPQAPLRF